MLQGQQCRRNTGDNMKVVKGEIEGKEVNLIQVTGAKEAGQCENCLGSNVAHKIVHKSMGIEEWCMDCNDEKFIEVNGHQSFQIYTLWLAVNGYAMGVVYDTTEEE